MKIKDIISKIEVFAPLSLSEEWDNTGWQINLGKKEAAKVMLALSPTLDVIEQAKVQGCNLIICHHPLFFSKIKKLSTEVFINKVAIEAIQNNIGIYSAHTNLDKAQGGINDVLATLFSLHNVETIDGFVRVGTVESISIKSFAQKIKTTLGCQSIKLINPCGIEKIQKVALCSGSGGDFINSVEADIFITGDIKYHTAIEVMDKAVLDVGHFDSERVVLPVLQNILSGVETIIA